jgi:hypothetical protein
MTTTRTIEDILAIRLRAAQLRVLERTMALVKDECALEQTWTEVRDAQATQELAKLIEAKRLANKDIVLVQREIDSQRGLPVEKVTYDPASSFAVQRYAAILMADNPALDAAQALKQARRDESERFADYAARYIQHDDEDDDQV